MSTNVRTINMIKSFWNPIAVEATASTAIPLVMPYYILRFPDTAKSLVIEEGMIEADTELRQLFAEFAQEDLEFAEMGMAEYGTSLAAEDAE